MHGFSFCLCGRGGASGNGASGNGNAGVGAFAAGAFGSGAFGPGIAGGGLAGFFSRLLRFLRPWRPWRLWQLWQVWRPGRQGLGWSSRIRCSRVLGLEARNCQGRNRRDSRCCVARSRPVRYCREILLAFAAMASLPAGSSCHAQTDAPLNPGFDIGILVNPARCGLDGELFDPLFRMGGLRSEPGSPELPAKRVSQTVNLNYKNQLARAFSDGSLKILSASYQARFFKERMALGVHAYSNTLNTQAMQDFQLMLTYAYHWSIVEDDAGNPLHRLSFGLQAGYRNYGYRTGNMQTGSMYDPSYTGGFNPSLLPFEELPRTRHLADGHAGVQYTGVFSSWRLDAGVAFFHLFRPETGILEEGYRVPLRFSAYASAVLPLGSWRRFGWNGVSRPGSAGAGGSELGFDFYYVFQPDRLGSSLSSVFYGGVSYRYVLQRDFSVGGALYFRSQRTFIPQVMLDLARFTLLFQMEFNANYSYNNLFSIGLGYRW